MHTAISWCESRRGILEPGWLISRIEVKNLERPHVDFSNGNPDHSVWQRESEAEAEDGALIAKTTATAVRTLLFTLDEHTKQEVHCGPLDEDNIRLWSNPELYVNSGGIRPDEAAPEVQKIYMPSCGSL